MKCATYMVLFHKYYKALNDPPKHDLEVRIGAHFTLPGPGAAVKAAAIAFPATYTTYKSSSLTNSYHVISQLFFQLYNLKKRPFTVCNHYRNKKTSNDVVVVKLI